VKQLQPRHILLFRLLKDHFLLLTRSQIERVFTLPTNSTNKALKWLVSEKYLERRYRADTFKNFQMPLYYLGSVGWRMAGNTAEGYKRYRNEVEQRAERQMDHLLSVYDVLLKFILESEVKRIISGEAKFWQESLGFGNIPDGWIQFKGGEAFIEVDRGTEAVGVAGKKIENYVRFEQSGAYGIMFPGCAFKLLFITTTEERIESLEKLTTSDDIWFCTMEEFLGEKLDHQHWFALRGFYALSISPKKEVQELP
jgi:hypothetical protein